MNVLYNGPKHIPNVTPTPLSPMSVTGDAPAIISGGRVQDNYFA